MTKNEITFHKIAKTTNYSQREKKRKNCVIILNCWTFKKKMLISNEVGQLKIGINKNKKREEEELAAFAVSFLKLLTFRFINIFNFHWNEKKEKLCSN